MCGKPQQRPSVRLSLGFVSYVCWATMTASLLSFRGAGMRVSVVTHVWLLGRRLALCHDLPSGSFTAAGSANMTCFLLDHAWKRMGRHWEGTARGGSWCEQQQSGAQHNTCMLHLHPGNSQLRRMLLRVRRPGGKCNCRPAASAVLLHRPAAARRPPAPIPARPARDFAVESVPDWTGAELLPAGCWVRSLFLLPPASGSRGCG